MRLLPTLVLAVTAVLLLPACDSDDEDDTPNLGSYAATFAGAYSADAEGVALFADLGVPPVPPTGSEADQSTYSLQFGPRPEAGPTGVPNMRFVLTQDDLDARALVFAPPDDGLPLLLNGTLTTASFSPSGWWTADSGRGAFDTISDERVTGTFEVRFTRTDRTFTDPSFEQVYTTATGTFEAVIVEAP